MQLLIAAIIALFVSNAVTKAIFSTNSTSAHVFNFALVFAITYVLA